MDGKMMALSAECAAVFERTAARQVVCANSEALAEHAENFAAVRTGLRFLQEDLILELGLAIEKKIVQHGPVVALWRAYQEGLGKMRQLDNDRPLPEYRVVDPEPAQ